MKNSQLDNPLKISDHTKKEMAKFFMRTSIPRILADMAKKEGDQGGRNSRIES